MKNPFLKPKVKKESDVEKYLKTSIEKIGGICYKAIFPGHNGCPDRVVILPGILIWVELKSVTGKLRPEQVREHERLKAMGQEVFVMRTHLEIDWLVMLLKNHRTFTRAA